MEPISKEEYLFILKDIIEFANSYNIDIFYTIHKVDDIQKGLYKNGIM